MNAWSQKPKPGRRVAPDQVVERPTEQQVRLFAKAIRHIH